MLNTQLKFLLLLLAFPGAVFSQLTIDGNYAGKNLYIQNPESADFAGEYCVTSVTINGQAFPDSLTQAAAFEIPLTEMGFQQGDTVHIVLEHQDGCRPKVLHPAGCYIPERTIDTAATTFTYDTKQRTFVFSKPVDYFIYDFLDKQALKGHGTSFAAKSLRKGSYYLYFDDQYKTINVGRKEGIVEIISCFK